MIKYFFEIYTLIIKTNKKKLYFVLTLKKLQKNYINYFLSKNKYYIWVDSTQIFYKY